MEVSTEDNRVQRATGILSRPSIRKDTMAIFATALAVHFFFCVSLLLTKTTKIIVARTVLAALLADVLILLCWRKRTLRKVSRAGRWMVAVSKGHKNYRRTRIFEDIAEPRNVDFDINMWSDPALLACACANDGCESAKTVL